MAFGIGLNIQEGDDLFILVHLMTRNLTLNDLGKNTVLHTDIVTRPKAVTIVLMVKSNKKNQKLSLPNKKLLIFAGIVLALAVVYGAIWLIHTHAVNADKARFEQANKDVQTVAGQVIAAVGQPADRKDGGKCSYAHQEFSKGPLSCEVYSYLAYGVNSPDDVNAIVQKVDPLAVLHGNPWQFKAVTEKPHQFVDGVQYSDNFEALRNLFDNETKSESYSDTKLTMLCGINYLYQNTIASLSGYPSFAISGSQFLLIDMNCGMNAKGSYYPIQN